jgi:hypothetical protein
MAEWELWKQALPGSTDTCTQNEETISPFSTPNSKIIKKFVSDN